MRSVLWIVLSVALLCALADDLAARNELLRFALDNEKKAKATSARVLVVDPLDDVTVVTSSCLGGR